MFVKAAFYESVDRYIKCPQKIWQHGELYVESADLLSLQFPHVGIK